MDNILIDAWTRANKLVVEYPLITGLVGTLLSLLSLLFHRVREVVTRVLGGMWNRLKTGLHRVLVTSCTELGIAR
jgi:hypothetical protein